MEILDITMCFVPSVWCRDIVRSYTGEYSIHVSHVILVIKDEILYYWRHFSKQADNAILKKNTRKRKLVQCGLWCRMADY